MGRTATTMANGEPEETEGDEIDSDDDEEEHKKGNRGLAKVYKAAKRLQRQEDCRLAGALLAVVTALMVMYSSVAESVPQLSLQ